MKKSKASVEAEKIYQTALTIALKERRKDRAHVASLLEAAVALRHPMATHALATWYLFGKGVRRDYKKGLELELLAATGGISEAAWNVAISYERGQGTRRRPALALRYYKRAARLGDADAPYEVGRCYFYGIGTPRKLKLAERWFARTRKSSNEVE